MILSISVCVVYKRLVNFVLVFCLVYCLVLHSWFMTGSYGCSAEQEERVGGASVIGAD